MVSPNSSSGSPSSFHAALQSSGVTSAANEEGCNDEPPPIPLPPAGNVAGGATSNSSHVFNLPDASNLTAHGHPEGQDINAAPRVQPKVYDYGSSDAKGLYRVESTTLSATTTATSTAPSTPYINQSVNSTQSSLTAVDYREEARRGGEVLVDIPLAAAAALSLEGGNSHTASPETVASALSVGLANGLESSDAKSRYEKDGPNKLHADKGVGWGTVLVRQVSNSLTLVRYCPRHITFLLQCLCFALHCVTFVSIK
jgi:Na+-exporting ATPase